MNEEAVKTGRLIIVPPCCGQEFWLAIARHEPKGVLASAAGDTRDAAIDLLKQRVAQFQPSFLVDEQPVWTI
jgi:hypothetical protein